MMELAESRKQIDELDRQIILLLEQRMDVAADIAAYKQSHSLPVLDEEREKKKLKEIKALCRPETADLLEELFSHVLTASRTYQTSVMREKNGK